MIKNSQLKVFFIPYLLIFFYNFSFLIKFICKISLYRYKYINKKYYYNTVLYIGRKTSFLLFIREKSIKKNKSHGVENERE